MARLMEITFLGTGSANPTPKKAASSTVLRYGEDLWMFDCGEGTQTQLMKSSLKAGKINRIFITHLHGDHLYGISGLMCTISQSNQRQEPLSIYGPLGLAKYLRVTLGLSGSDLGFRFRVIELVPTPDMYQPSHEEQCNVSPDDHPLLHPCEDAGLRVDPVLENGVPSWPLFQDKNIEIVAGKLNHRIPSFGFVIREHKLPGSLCMNKLRAFGLEPGPICKQLREGSVVKSPNSGQDVKLSDVVGDEQPGRKVVICGDSCQSSSLASLAQNADVFVHEATLENGLKELAISRGHSTPEMAAGFALEAGAKMLYLTHFSQRYTESSSRKGKTEKTIHDLLSEAKETFGENCDVAEDLKTFTIKPCKST